MGLSEGQTNVEALAREQRGDRNRRTTEDLAPQVTVDALMFSFRSGTAVLARDDVKERLSRISEGQLREVCTQLRNRNVAKSWTDDEIKKLIVIWTTCHG
jgi:Arc/MetJ family transcription regulator